MLEWHDYISGLLTSESSFDGVSLSFSNTESPVGVPPIIKTSILMLDRMQQCQGKYNILVFPERLQSIFIFTLIKLLHNISEGRIEHTYKPEDFSPGEKLRFGKTVVEFIGLDKAEGTICIRLADMTYKAPFELFPFFQKTNAKKLSKWTSFVESKRAAQDALMELSPEGRYLKLLADHKTHMESSIVNMTSIINAKELINHCTLCGQNLKDIVLVGQADFEGNIKNIGTGQLGGIPAIVLASDLFAISEMAQKGHPIQSVLIDASNTNALVGQLQALDELIRLDVPITCVTDVVNSFDLQPYLERGFNLWRWDETSITDKLYNANALVSDIKTKHCANRKVNYLVADGNEISTAIRLLYSHRKESQTASAQMLKLFDKLFSLAFTVLRETVPFDYQQHNQIRTTLEECKYLLALEKSYISEKTYSDYCTIIDCFNATLSQEYVFQKNEALKKVLSETEATSVAIVIPERCDKFRVLDYWNSWCKENCSDIEITVCYPAEYYAMPCDQCEHTIVVGWLKRAIMRKILYGFNSGVYTVLLYDHEKRWKNFDVSRWNNALDKTQNRKTIEKSFATDKIRISTSRFMPPVTESVDTPKTDELSEIEVVLRDNKFRQYFANGGQKSADDTTEAIPVNYVGGFLAFYRTGHKVISASSIIESDSDKIESKLPDELKLGDFIVVRESDHDLVKEMADIILERNGKKNLRELSGKWRETLEIEQLFYTVDEICQHFKDVGCTRGYPTIRGWLLDDDVIAPQSKQDLEHIVAVTGSEMLKEMLDQVYDAAQTVRSAHVQAGRQLSELLRNRIVEALKQYGDIDPFNIWEPIEMQIEGVGIVRILKIIDIGEPVIVDISNTNRLLDE